MSQENMDLVRSMYASWERGDYGSAAWAHPEIETVMADGPAPGRWIGVVGAAEGWRDFLNVWEEYHSKVEEYRELDDDRVLVLIRRSGRGKKSGIDLADMAAKGAVLYHVRRGQVTRQVVYLDRDRAFADLGLSEEAMSQENVKVVRRIYEALNERAIQRYPELIDPDFVWIPDERFTFTEGPIRGRENVQRYWEDLAESIHPDVELEELFDQGDQVMALVRVRGQGDASGVALDTQTAHLWTLRHGRAVKVEVYADRDKALEAVELWE
jgi:ketosteroid isomerase-like protein